ncbi:MAG: RDD family protein [Planctomycetota bacterium]
MREWFYAVDETTSDPISEQELSDLFRAKHLPPSTLVWTDGMEDWEPASAYSSFFKKSKSDRDTPPASVPPSEPAPKAQGAESLSAVRPWGRFFARKIDIALLFLGLDYFERMNDNFGAYQYAGSYTGVLHLLIALVFIEPLLLCSFGTTPGKMLLGIHVHYRGEGKMTYSDAFTRTYKVLVRGLGLGIPVLSIFCQVYAMNQLQKYGTTSWDQEASFEVEYRAFSVGRGLLTGLVLFYLGLIRISIF